MGFNSGFKGLIASGALRNGSSKCRVHSHTKSMRTWFTCTGTVMAKQMQLWTSTGEDIRCAEHQPGLFLPTCFVRKWAWDTSYCTCVIRTQIDTKSWGTGRNCKYGTTEPDYQHTSDLLKSPCSTKPRVANIALRWLVSISPSASTTSAPRWWRISTGILSLFIP